jgi:hypothetical protein
MTLALLSAASANAAAPKLSPKQVVSNMQAAWRALPAYVCRMDAWSRKGSQEKTQAFNFSFQKPHLIRLKVLINPHKGADVVYRDGKIRAAERVLGIRVKTGMANTDPMFFDLRGAPFWQVDMGSQIAAIQGLLPSSKASVARDGAAVTLTLKWRGADKAAKDGVHAYVKTWKLDAKTWFPIERATLQDGQKVEEVKAANIDLHASLKDGDFNL